MQSKGIQLDFHDAAHCADASTRRSWTGFSIETTILHGARAVGYGWDGSRHYLANHDIVLRDGEIDLAGEIVGHQKDIRNRMTFVPQGARVSGWSDLAAGMHSYSAIFFHPELVETELERCLFGTSPRPMLYFEDDGLSRTLQRIERLVAHEEETDPLATETLGLLAILQLYPMQLKANPDVVGKLSFAQKGTLLSFFEASVATQISLSEMAALVELSRFHFARSFTRTFGRPPHQYLLAFRIGLAATLLARTRIPVAEIAARTGFASPPRLSAAFRRSTGHSPRSFRSAVRQADPFNVDKSGAPAKANIS